MVNVFFEIRKFKKEKKIEKKNNSETPKEFQSLVHDKYAIALISSESVTVGYLPKCMSKLAHFFVKYARKIRCEIIGSKRYSSDLEQGGLEIPAKVIFQSSNGRVIEEMKKKFSPLIEEYNKKH